MIQVELSMKMIPSLFKRTELLRTKKPKRKHAYEKCVKKEDVNGL